MRSSTLRWRFACVLRHRQADRTVAISAMDESLEGDGLSHRFKGDNEVGEQDDDVDIVETAPGE